MPVITICVYMTSCGNQSLSQYGNTSNKLTNKERHIFADRWYASHRCDDATKNNTCWNLIWQQLRYDAEKLVFTRHLPRSYMQLRICFFFAHIQLCKRSDFGEHLYFCSGTDAFLRRKCNVKPKWAHLSRQSHKKITKAHKPRNEHIPRNSPKKKQTTPKRIGQNMSISVVTVQTKANKLSFWACPKAIPRDSPKKCKSESQSKQISRDSPKNQYTATHKRRN